MVQSPHCSQLSLSTCIHLSTRFTNFPGLLEWDCENAANQPARWAKSVQRFPVARKVCIAFTLLLQACVAVSPEALKYSGDFWVGCFAPPHKEENTG